MKSKKTFVALSTAGVAVLLLSACTGGGAPSATSSADGGAERVKIATVIGNLQDSFWQTVMCGAKSGAEKDGNVDQQFFTTPTTEPAGLQASYNAAALTNPDGYFLNLFQSSQLVNETKTLMSKGIPVVGTQPMEPQALYSVPYVDFSSDELVDEFLARLPDGPGTIAVLAGTAGIAPVEVRWQPLVEAVESERPDIEVVIEYTNFDVTKATTAATSIVLANPDLKMILASNGPDSVGVVAALKQLKVKPGELTVWAWDGDPVAIDALRAGYISDVFAQSAFARGEAAITEIAEAIRTHPKGEALEPRPQSEWSAPPLGHLTTENIDSEESQQYLYITTEECPYE
ncbi:sugar ABC transporter substrate-binding protein [Microbacterium sp. GXF0217]